MEAPRPLPPAAVSAPALVPPVVHDDARSSFVSLVVAPGFDVVGAHLRNQREIVVFMMETLREFARIHEDSGARLMRLAESSEARFERSLIQSTITSFFRAPAQSQQTQQLHEVGTVNVAWTTLRERMTVMGLGHKHVAAAIDKVADTLRAYLDATRDAAAKVDNWGSRLADAMNGYIRKSEEAKDVFHSKSRNARLAAKILEEAERQAEKGGYTRAALLTESRMTKLREAALRAHEEEQQSGLAYRVSLDTVAKKQNELYTVRMPRVMMELQRLVEQRTVQLRECLLQFVQEAKALGPMLDESLDAVRITVEGINAAIDTKVFVADNVSDDCIPRVFEFVPFDAQSFIPAPGTVIAFDASVGAAGVPAAPPPQAAPESADAAAVRLRATLADAITRQRLQAFVTDATQSAGLQFLLAAQAYRGRPETERTQAASLLYQQYLADDAPEPVQSLLAHETRSALVNNVLRESLDAETFEPASRQVFAALGPVHEDFLRGQAGGSGPPAMPSTPPPKSPKPSLVLLQKPPPDTEDDLLGGSDDELLNRDDNLDDLLEEDLMA